MAVFSDLPSGDFRPFPQPRPDDIGDRVDVRMPDCVERLIRAGLERQANAGNDWPKIIAASFDGESQAVMVVVVEEEPGCGRLTHRVGIWPPGARGYQACLELPTVNRVLADIRAGGDGTVP